MKKLALMAMLSLGSAYAIEVTVTENPGCDLGAAQCAALTNQIRTDLNADLPDVSIDKYGTGISDANNFAQKGQTSEYGRDFDLFVINASVGAGLKGDVDDLEDNPGAAEGVALGGTIGATINMSVLPIDKLGFIEFDKLDLSFSIMSYGLDQDLSEAEFEGDISSFNIMARYRIVDGMDIVPGNLLRWGGVHVHTGIQRSTMDLKLTKSFDDQEVEDGANTAELNNASAEFTIESAVTSVPIEISTNIRLLYALSIYGGLGFDLNSGTTDVELDSSGSATLTSAGTYGATISANESGGGDVTATNQRMFAGFQLNVPLVSLFAHYNKALGEDIMSVNAGLKVYW